jgi:Fur family ferric uptake transcriptional regulator
MLAARGSSPSLDSALPALSTRELEPPSAATYVHPMPSRDNSACRARFIEFLAGKNLRITAQREAIIETVFSTQEHFTAEQLLDWSRRRDKSVSRATVYRTLPLLTESGMVREMDFGKDHKVYDPNYADHPNHSHLICQDCDKIVEFESDKIAKLEDEISHRLGFSVRTQRLQITASCDELKKLGHCSKKACASAHR